ncbi:ATP-binding protein [Candidatus Micrarchaeota archaeon]|nr:ATP-binding protein [Candidatus Micrarchaeota archaeon]
MKKLLQGEDPKKILYFSFDTFGKTELSEVLKTAEQLAGVRPKFVFLDEVQKLDNWAEQVKRVYDLTDIKFFVTGSESLFVKKTSKESLGGRIFEFKISPLTFGEYLSFKGVSPHGLRSEDMDRLLEHYMATGGFPELVDEDDAFFIRKYLREGIIEKALFREIPGRFRIEDPSLLERIFNIITDNPGLQIDKNTLARELGVFRTTVSKYLFYLESSFLVKSLYNYSRNASTSEKKLKKYYPTFSCLGIGSKNDPSYVGKVVETVCVLKADAKFFWRTPQKDEVDIVLTDPLRPIEVKYRERPDAKGVLKFQREFNVSSGLVITKNLEKKETTISYVPFVKWLLQ